ncbi:MAG: hypothetical protein ACK5T0_08505, partial [Vampirovibrionales bacterium]
MANSPLLIPSFSTGSSNAIINETKALETQALQFTQPRPQAQAPQVQTENVFRSGLQPLAYLPPQLNNNTVNSFAPPLREKPNYMFVSSSRGQQSKSGGNQR